MPMVVIPQNSNLIFANYKLPGFAGKPRAHLSRGCRGGEVPIPPTTRQAALASGQWWVDEVTNKTPCSISMLFCFIHVFLDKTMLS
jgi:hypothetical protein